MSLIKIARVRELMDRIFYRKSYPEMNRSVKTQLRERFYPEMKNLKLLLGRSPPGWD